LSTQQVWQEHTRANAKAEALNYRNLDKEVKKSCKQDKKGIEIATNVEFNINS